jgi:hypothetical protein
MKAIDSPAPARFDLSVCPSMPCHDVASAEAGRSRPRSSIRVLAKKG